MAKRKRWQKMKRATWAGRPSALELEIERKIHAIEDKYRGKTVDQLPKAVIQEYGRLHSELLAESQRRSGLTLIKIMPNAKGDGATYDARNFLRVVRDTQAWIDAGLTPEQAIARAVDDERWRQKEAE